MRATRLIGQEPAVVDALTAYNAEVDAAETAREHSADEMTSETVEARVEAAAPHQHSAQVVELLAQGILVRLAEGDRVIANMMPVR